MAETPFPVPGGTPGWSLERDRGIASDDVWAVGAGSDGDMSLASVHPALGGNGWQLADNVPMPGDEIEFNALLPLASNDVYTAGSWFTGGAGYGPLIMHYDGSANGRSRRSKAAAVR